MESIFVNKNTMFSVPMFLRSKPTIRHMITASVEPKRMKILNKMSVDNSSDKEMPVAHQISSTSATTRRRSAEFHPSVWGDHFLRYLSQPTMDLDVERQFEELKNEVKTFLEAASEKSLVELLDIIDDIQRLGISYLFEKEIYDALRKIHGNSSESLECSNHDHDLHTTALMFRLLRQHGYKIPCSVFKKFKGPDGNFDKWCESDSRGLFSLYEASHYRLHGESILDEARAFTISSLTSMKEDLSPPLRDEITRAFKHPFYMSYRRIESWHFIKFYEQDDSHNEVLLRLAKLDFNRLQKIHQKEVGELTRWWKSGFDVEKNFPFMRQRMVENYFIGLPAYQPQHALYRDIYTKVCCLITIIDDTFDAYGTYEELELFVHAVERWDMEVIDELPEYLQICYKGLIDFYREIEEMLPEERKSFSKYGIESMKLLVRAYFQEAKWFFQGYIPPLEEYMEAARATGTAITLYTVGFLAYEEATRDDYEWLHTDPKMIRACNTIYRLRDDLITHQFEQKRGHQPSSVECYMKQYGVTAEVAKHELRKHIDDAWKDINEELFDLSANASSMHLCYPLDPRSDGWDVQ